MGRGGDGTNDTDEQERAAAAVTADAPPTELKRAPTKHPKSAEGGAWGCEWFDPPPSSKGEDDRWFNRHGEVVSLRNLYGTAGLYMCFTLWVIPLDLLGIFYWGISIKEAAIGFCVWYAIASLALTMNHRFFSHAAFKTSRPWRFVLAVVTLYGMQFGPIWWASKHRLHHKFCDQPADPHSWKQTSFFYAWWAWFHGHKEQVRASAAPRASPRASRVTRPPAPPAQSRRLTRRRLVCRRLPLRPGD
jgi:hypothetical protein